MRAQLPTEVAECETVAMHDSLHCSSSAQRLFDNELLQLQHAASNHSSA
jgi:hypothetical protein